MPCACGHVFESYDGGRSWRDISRGLPDAAATDLLVVDGELVVSMDVGVFVANAADPTSWAKLGTGMPHAAVSSLTLTPARTRSSPPRMAAACGASACREPWVFCRLSLGRTSMRAAAGASVAPRPLPMSRSSRTSRPFCCTLISIPSPLPLIEETASNLRNSLIVDFPLGHNVLWHDCPISIRNAFIADPTSRPDTSCVADMPKIKFGKD